MLKGVLGFIVCQCILFYFLCVNFHISICVFYKHRILVLYLSDFMNFSVELKIYCNVGQFFAFWNNHWFWFFKYSRIKGPLILVISKTLKIGGFHERTNQKLVFFKNIFENHIYRLKTGSLVILIIEKSGYILELLIKEYLSLILRIAQY